VVPAVQSKHGTDPYAPRHNDPPGVADWRRRMASEPGKALYKERSKAECANAWARRMGLTRLLVRGKNKARAVLLWFRARSQHAARLWLATSRCGCSNLR